MPLYTVSQVTRYLKESLERDAVLVDLWVSGELTNLSRSAAGHAYFALKEGNSQLRCVLFRDSSRGFDLADGLAVAAHGHVTVYEARGEVQLIVDLVRPEGLGAARLELERLKAALEAEGLFEPSRKRSLPPFPRRLAVITSPFGAVWHDIQNVIRRRYPLVELALVPCQVQGDNAVPTIIEAFQVVGLESDLDAVILARGGGSMEELWPFNDEAVARAIYASRSPVISAVGHETDVTLADLVADLRAPTPSAAAELVVPDSRELLAGVAAHGRSLYRGMMQVMAQGAGDVNGLMQRLGRRAPDTGARRQQVDDLLHRAAGGLRGATALARERVRGVEGRLVSLDPGAVLRRGYAVVRRGADGAPITSTQQVASGDSLQVQVADGAFDAEVTAERDGTSASDGGA